MNLLILGGTRFVGRHLAEAALARGHRITLFNRGQSDPNPGIDVEQLRGDRDGDLTALRGRRWEAVIDTSGYVPRIVRSSAELLARAVGHYTFISTASVYAPDASGRPFDEEAPVHRIEDETREDVEDPIAYGTAKVLCERTVEELMPGRTLVPRLSLVVGPLDPTDRFTYWPTRVARGGSILAFDHPARPIVPFVDARDAAEWIVASIEAGRTGIFNVAGRAGLTVGEVLETCRDVADARHAAFVWVSETFLIEHGVGPWVELPLWVPQGRDYLIRLSSVKAVAAGLRLRPLAETVRDVLAWDRARSVPVERRAGLPAHREVELLQRWQTTTAYSEAFEADGRAWRIDLARGSALEQLGRLQLRRLLDQYPLTKWTFTSHLRIESWATPHSHPVLTLTTKYVDRDDVALAAFLHEQIHWFEDARPAAVRGAMSELRQMYPGAPTAPPEGARGETSTYVNLIVCYLEYAALVELLGIESARRVLENHRHYTWIYQTVLRDSERLRDALARHGLLIE